MKYVIIGDPVPLARHRHSGRRTWDAQKQLKLIWGIYIRNQHQAELGEQKYSGPLHLDVVFYCGIPNTSRKRRAFLNGTYHVFVPDLDNCVKWVCDVATGIIFDNDCIISSISAKKIYDEQPRTEFIITPLEGLK